MSMTNHQEQQEKDHIQEVLFSSMDKSHKNPNIDLPSPLSSSQDFETSIHQHNIIHGANETREEEGIITKAEDYEEIIKELENPQQLNTFKDGPASNPVSVSPLVVGEEDNPMPLSLPPSPQVEVPIMVEESGRERLKRHRENMAGRVWIPDIWGHEDLLKDWIDCTVFDSSLGNKTIMSARAALVQEAGRSTLRIHNQC